MCVPSLKGEGSQGRGTLHVTFIYYMIMRVVIISVPCSKVFQKIIYLPVLKDTFIIC